MSAPSRQFSEPSSPAFLSRRTRTGGADGNELLTSFTGAVLLVLLAVIGLTIIALGRLLSVHLFVGLVLVGPIALKMASTGYRFARYYSGNAEYRLKGPPPTPLRLMAPMVILSTLVVMASGITLLLVGPSSREKWLPIHKVSFFVWLAFTAVHVLAHLPGVARALKVDVAGIAPRTSGGDPSGQLGRSMALLGVIVAGVVLAIVLIPDYGVWLSSHRFPHH
jgi:hypothetical protein